ncbi:MAG: ABC transporter ATP-binding protein [Oscillospiraceae bacterium]|jgi:ATP-binding cassette subfamily B protein
MKEKKENPIKVLFSFVGEDKGKMTLSVILAIIGEAFGALPFLAAAMLANDVYGKAATLSRAALWAGIAAVGIILRMLLCWRSSLRSHGIAFTILKNIRRAIADKMRKVPMGIMLETPSGKFKTLMVDNVGKLEDSIAHLIPETPSQIAVPVGYIILMFILDWRMGLASLITLPLSFPFIMGMMKGYSEKMATYLRSGNEMNSSLVEYIGGIQVIKAFGRSGMSYGKFSNAVRFFHDSTLDWWKQCWFWMAVVKAIIPSTMLGTLPIGALLYMNNEISLPVFIACIIIPIGFIAPLIKIAFGGEQLTLIAANLKPIQEFLATEEQLRPEKPVNFDGSSYVFENVAFSYGKDKEVLHEISFETKPNTMTALVGPSGSGKSTIAKLMAGFWDASGGTVSFGGHDIKSIPFNQLMNEISYVAQDNFLFDKSIRDNIRMGKPDANDTEVEAAAKAANCHDFIMTLENGYATLAGDAGDRLSGGERQRITIARAMLKKSSVVILDEATAYADPESEALIQQAVSRLVKGKTLIVVAHRLSTIQNAQQILVIENGRIAGRGTQNELLSSCQLYKTMWEQHIQAADYSEKRSGAIC